MKHLLIRAPRFWVISHALHIWKSCKCWLIKRNKIVYCLLCSSLAAIKLSSTRTPKSSNQNAAFYWTCLSDWWLFFSSVSRKLVLESFITVSLDMIKYQSLYMECEAFYYYFYYWIVRCLTLAQHNFTLNLMSDIRRKPDNIYSLH